MLYGSVGYNELFWKKNINSIWFCVYGKYEVIFGHWDQKWNLYVNI